MSSLVWVRYEAEVRILQVAESDPTRVRRELKEIRGTDPEADRVKATIRDLSSRQGIFKRKKIHFSSHVCKRNRLFVRMTFFRNRRDRLSEQERCEEFEC